MPHKNNQFQGNTNERYPILYMPCHLDHGTSVFHLVRNTPQQFTLEACMLATNIEIKRRNLTKNKYFLCKGGRKHITVVAMETI